MKSSKSFGYSLANRSNPAKRMPTGQIVHIGPIEQVDYQSAMAKVRLDGVLTGWLPLMAPRAGGDRVWFPYDVGEQVLVLAPSDDLARAVILGSLYADASPPNGSAGTQTRISFADGSLFEHDAASGDALLHVTGNLALRADGNVTINGIRIDLNG